jgi:hypothetical protein
MQERAPPRTPGGLEGEEAREQVDGHLPRLTEPPLQLGRPAKEMCSFESVGFLAQR